MKELYPERHMPKNAVSLEFREKNANAYHIYCYKLNIPDRIWDHI